MAFEMRNLAHHMNQCSINTATLGFQSHIDDVIEAVARAGFGEIAPWRVEVEGQDVAAIARHIKNAGLKLSGYCRSTYIPAVDAHTFRANVESNKRALDDAAILGAPAFVMVVGGLPAGSRDLAGARQQVLEASAELREYGKSVGVRIALEPLHPAYAADRSVLTLLSEALTMCETIEPNAIDPWVGVAIDCYHVWWDPDLPQGIAAAGAAKRIFAFHVCDWLVPTLDVLNDRGMMGDGVIDIQGIRSGVETSGYSGSVEVEIFSSRNWWQRPMVETLAMCRTRLETAT
jgi:sugar phosphate isomerase/epimerase